MSTFKITPHTRVLVKTNLEDNMDFCLNEMKPNLLQRWVHNDLNKMYNKEQGWDFIVAFKVEIINKCRYWNLNL